MLGGLPSLVGGFRPLALYISVPYFNRAIKKKKRLKIDIFFFCSHSKIGLPLGKNPDSLQLMYIFVLSA